MGLITWVLTLPLLGIVLLLLLPGFTTKEKKNTLSGWIAFFFSLAAFAVSVPLYLKFDSSFAGYQFIEKIAWLPQLGLEYHVALDGISLILFLATTALMPFAFVGSFQAIQLRRKEFYVWLLLLEIAILGVLVAQNLLLFYIFWELMFIPMFFLIGIWGGANRWYATIKFVLFTVVGSLMMLAGIIYLALQTREQFGGFNLNFSSLFQLNLPPQVQLWLFIAFGLAFAIKVPMFPLHTWLPDFHGETPNVGSVDLAGILMKLGAYGFIRLGVPLFPLAALKLAPVLQTLAVIGIVYGACLALVQKDMKRLVAYSSLSHLGYVMLGVFAINAVAVQGAVLQMVNHAISSGALFLLVGILCDRRNAREISEYGGLARQLPIFSTIFLIISLSSMALPGTNGFVGEFLILLGSFKSAWSHFLATGGSYRLVLMVLATTGVILVAYYMLWLVQRLFFGPLQNEKNKSLKDLSLREGLILVPFVVLVFWIQLYPQPLLQKMDLSAKTYIQQVQPMPVLPEPLANEKSILPVYATQISISNPDSLTALNTIQP